jgi:hypothetical protein
MDTDPSGAHYHVGGFTTRELRVYALGSSTSARLHAFRTASQGPGLPVTVVFPYRAESEGTEYHLLEERHFLSPSALRLHEPSGLDAPGQGADYLVISHRDFVSACEELAGFRAGPAGGSLSPTRVVDVEDVYELFSYGQEDPTAIRDFLQYAYTSWSPVPRFVTLVGDTTDDYRNYRGLVAPGYDPPSFLPARETYLDGVQDLRAISDSWFAAVDGEDPLPDILIGRIPVRFASELEQVVQKLRDHEPVAPGEAGRRIQLFADDDIGQDRSECWVTGVAGDKMESLVAQYLPGAQEANLRRRYGGSYVGAGAPGRWQGDIEADLDEGVGVEFYLGHGNAISIARHCDDGLLPIMDFDSLGRLQPGSVLPLFVAATCDASQFDFAAQRPGGPVTDSVGERFLKAADRGHLSSIGTTASLLYSDGESLTEGVFLALYGDEPLPVVDDDRLVGSVALGAMLDHFRRAGLGSYDGLRTTVILGDPATRLPIEEP